MNGVLKAESYASNSASPYSSRKSFFTIFPAPFSKMFSTKITKIIDANSGKIEICPLAYMRGRNFHHCFIVADECQNASEKQLIMLLTRIGKGSKEDLQAGRRRTRYEDLRRIDNWTKRKKQ